MVQTKRSQQTTGTSIDAYRGYAGLKPLAGLFNMREAASTGLSVSESVE